MSADRSSLQLWREKLEYLRQQEAIAADPGQKFALKKQIEEARGKMAELDEEPAPAREGPVAHSLHQLTPPVPDFTGRKGKLRVLRQAVKRGGVAITGVRGMGGAGKTELARRLAAELKAGYPDAQIELNLKGVEAQPLSPADALSAVLRVFHPTAKLPERAEELAALLRQALEGKRALLLLDNAKDAHQIAPLLPLPPGCLVLVTSRQHFTLPGLAAVDLGVMEPPEARALLLKIAPRIGGQADALAGACGRLPLALRLAASLLAVSQHLDVAAYIRQLRESRQRLAMLDQAREYTAEDLGLEASFTLSFQQLGSEPQRLFTQLAVFPASFDRAAVRAVWAVEAARADDALDQLLRLSLLEWNQEAQRYELHDLLREFARHRCLPAGREAQPEELDAAKRRHAEHFIGVGDRADELFLKGGENVLRGLALFDRERAHLEAAFDWLASRADKASARLLISLVNAVAYTSNLRFHPRQSIRWLEAQAKAAQLAGDRRGEGNALGNLGNAYADLGEARKAIEFHEQALVILREIGDRRGEGAILGNLGNAYGDLGEARKAIEFHEQALVIDREIGDRRGEGQDLGNLGNAYGDLGEARKAIEFYEQRLVIAREIGDRRGEGNALGNLGSAYADLGEARKAIEFYEQALVIDREIGDRRGEGTDLWNSADEFWKLGDRSQAIARAEAALAIYEAIEDPHAAKVRAKLAKWRKA